MRFNSVTDLPYRNLFLKQIVEKIISGSSHHLKPSKFKETTNIHRHCIAITEICNKLAN